MSIDPSDTDPGDAPDTAALLARATSADARAGVRLAAAIDDFLLPNDARLDDRLRAALSGLLHDMVAIVAGALRQHTTRSLAEWGEPTPAAAWGVHPAKLVDRLSAVGLLQDGRLLRELIARARQEAIAAALPADAPEVGDQPSLLARLAHQDDAVVAARAAALLAAENRRRSNTASGIPTHTELSADAHHQLVWWVAAALREGLAGGGGGDGSARAAAVDRALAGAATRALAAHDESDRPEIAAMRLAAAFDPHADELPGLLIESLGDRRLTLFVALLAHAMGLDYDDAREIVLDPGADRLWLVLRALELDRTAIARIGLALSDADPRRDVDAFVDALDTIAAMPAAMARTALVPLMLPPDYRAAIFALAQGRAR